MDLLVRFESVEIRAQEPIQVATEKKNYFARKLPEDAKLRSVKEKILKNMDKQARFPQTKAIPLGDCFDLLREHEKRVQEFQIQQAANKLLAGKSTTYDYGLAYRERSWSESEKSGGSDDDDDDNFNEYYDDEGDQEGSRIDRLHTNEANKMKFKLNDGF